ncbi:MAG: CBS domain-containing protein [Nitrospirota bacterium]
MRTLDQSTDILVKDVMTANVVCVRKYDAISQVIQTLSELNIGGLPVVDNENRVVGIISEADILSAMGIEKEPTFRNILKHMFGEKLPERKLGDIVGDIMTSPAVTVRADADLSVAAQAMHEKRIRRLPVVDAENRLVGIVSRRDIIRAISRKQIDLWKRH